MSSKTKYIEQNKKHCTYLIITSRAKKVWNISAAADAIFPRLFVKLICICDNRKRFNNTSLFVPLVLGETYTYWF